MSTIFSLKVALFFSFLICMTLPILDLSSASNWVKVHEITLVAPPSSIPNHNYPIPAYTIPVTFDRRFLAVGASSTMTKPSWRLAFFLSTVLQIPAVGNAENGSIFIPLGLSLVQVPLYSAQYSLKARIPKWHLEMTMAVWQYVGIESDISDLVDQINQRLTFGDG